MFAFSDSLALDTVYLDAPYDAGFAELISRLSAQKTREGDPDHTVDDLLASLAGRIEPDGALRIEAVVDGRAETVVVPHGCWHVAGPDPDEAVRIELPDGHLGFMVMMPGVPTVSVKLPLADVHDHLSGLDRQLAELAAAQDLDDPTTSLEAYRGFRQTAFDGLAAAIEASDGERLGKCVGTLLWCALSCPGDHQTRAKVSRIAAENGKVGVVLVVHPGGRVAVLAGQELAAPKELLDLIPVLDADDLVDAATSETARAPTLN